MQFPNISRFPKLELSYETVHHKKVCASDSVALAIPMGKKHFIWFFERRCYLVDMNKEKHPVAIRAIIDIPVPQTYLLETVLFVTHNAEDERSPFIVEEIYVWKGLPLSNLCFADRLGFLHDFMRTFEPTRKFALPGIWCVASGSEITPHIPLNLGYAVHHVQYRDTHRHAPYINVALPRKGVIPDAKPEPKKAATPLIRIPTFDYRKPQYRKPAVFQVVADVQFDIYHAYACGSNGTPIYCGPLGIPTYKTSVFMNSVFRNIRENRNLDYIEESDDEDDFENTDTTKYVDLEKVANIECAFNAKFKKWVPLRITNERAVPIGRLVYDSCPMPNKR